MYAKARPFGYQKRKKTGEVKNWMLRRVQTVKMRVPYEILVRNKDGKVVYKGVGKNRKPVKEIFYRTVTRPVKHYFGS